MIDLSNPLFERTRLVFNPAQLQALTQAHVLIAGVGGVGGFAAEALARVGVGKITLVDHDQVSPSNINRQIIALNSTVGQNKVDVMAQRIADIHPACQVTPLARFLATEEMPEFVQNFDYVVDAIDSLNCKVALVAAAHQHQIPVVSSMGAGRRFDPSKIELTDLSKTHTCALARNMRQRLKKQGIKKGIPVVFSTELPQAPGPMETIEGARDRVVNGSVSYMPAIFGLMLAGKLVQMIIDEGQITD